jgi:hypothetical protein
VTTVFFDRSIGKTLPRVLKMLGLDVEAHDDHYGPTTPDTEWLPQVSARGRVIVTNDDRIRFNVLERQALIDSQAGIFVIGGNRSNRQVALTLLLAWDAIQEAAATTPRPFAFTVHANGRLAPLSLKG